MKLLYETYLELIRHSVSGKAGVVCFSCMKSYFKDKREGGDKVYSFREKNPEERALASK